MPVNLEASLAAEAPPVGLSPPLQALWWLRKGGLRPGPEWEKAHEICQRGEGERGHDLVHGLAHWIEGDLGNADYWYRRAGARRDGSDIAAEWARVVAALGT
jgi:hypothetical protein